jgi:fucose permease
MFVPQAVTAVAASLLGGRLTQRLSLKSVYLLGLLANIGAMALLLLSQFVMTNQPLAYGLLLLATASLGVGFGLTVPALNTFVAAFFPQKVDRAVLSLNALLGLGTALAPVFVAIFLGLGWWWGLPAIAGVLLLALLLFSLGQPLQAGTSAGATARSREKTALPSRFWLYAAFALLYGVCETTNGNWATLYMTKDLGASATQASVALTVFWGMATVGRVLFAAIGTWFPPDRTYRVLPFVVAAAFLVTAVLPATGANPLGGVLAFGLAGLGCSALLPLTISFGEEDLTVIAASVAGGLIAFYQMGYGLAAFGVGPLQEHAGLHLSTIFGLAALVALAMGALAVILKRGAFSTATSERVPAG